MSGPMLKELDITNFRSIRGHIHAPLDANVVLIHGENGAGKTSLLSAIELALTGAVQSLQRADPNYERQLLHRLQTSGNVILKTDTQSFEILLNETGAETGTLLEERLSSFFSERAYLPQSLLGQLLQIYQDSGSDMESPLARFVGKLLGLDRLDALEAGLKPFADLRNVRKFVHGWSAIETERIRLDRLVSDQQRVRREISDGLNANLKRLAQISASLGLDLDVAEDNLDAVERFILTDDDARAHDVLNDQLRQLGAIGREIDQAGQASADVNVLAARADATGTAYQLWDNANGDRIVKLRERIDKLLPNVTLPSEMAAFAEQALRELHAAATEAISRVVQARFNATRQVAADGERRAAISQRDSIDREMAAMSNDADSMSSALAELSAFIADDVCPVCDRDFSETSHGPLHDHVIGKIRRLSGAAERLLTLGTSRSEAQSAIDRLDREIGALAARIVEPKDIAELDRRVTELNTTKGDLEAMAAELQEGNRLLEADITARRALAARQSRDVALLSARETLSAFAQTISAQTLDDAEGFDDAALRLGAQLNAENVRLSNRLSIRREAKDLLESIRSSVHRRDEADKTIAIDFNAWNAAGTMLEKAQVLRNQALTIRGAVDTVRSSIIRREFNDRLNKVWRDLFVRLAPGEPFVPAFSVPPSSTQRLQPKLITTHRLGGDAGGTPGAMLSAGNLNTAALTLFVALHLSVPRELPWLILDDPVQSMDDVHIAHFASLLRTLSKEQERQVIIAVHDRQLFEYLRLELSPAFKDDSLLTLELSRSSQRNTLCDHHRYHFQDEIALMSAA